MLLRIEHVNDPLQRRVDLGETVAQRVPLFPLRFPQRVEGLGMRSKLGADFRHVPVGTTGKYTSSGGVRGRHRALLIEAAHCLLEGGHTAGEVLVGFWHGADPTAKTRQPDSG